MYRFNVGLFFLIAREVEIWRSNAHVRNALERKTLEKNYLQDIREKVRIFSEACEGVGLESAPPHVERMLKRMDSEGEKYNSEKLLSDSNELYYRIQDEMKKLLVMRIPKERQEFYENPLKGWEGIIKRFPKVIRDVEESRKCFAFDRYSAAVFHSIQIIEVGLIELGTFIKVNDPISGWTAVAQRLKKILDTKYQDLTEFEQVNRPFLEQLQATVEALKNAWRNKISHSHGRLVVMTGEEFHPDVAEEILTVTRSFMRRLAEGLPARST